MIKQFSIFAGVTFICVISYSQQPLKELDTFVQKLLTDWKIPGIAIGIVKNDKVYFSKGYGYRNLEEKFPVTTHTIFPIASVTKTFTGIDLCLLELEGIIDLQQPVQSYLPAFSLFNEELTRQTTLTDLLSHRTGLPSHDAAWWGTDKTREQLFNGLQYLQPNKPFRSEWQYSNLSYMAAGYILQQVSGQCWEEYTRQKILTPLGMNHSTFTVKDIEKGPDFSWPYIFQNGQIQRIGFRNLDAVGPCGSINSSLEDMLTYLQMLVQKGQYMSRQVIPVKVLEKAQHPIITMPYVGSNGSTSAYGMGFQQETYDKYLLIEHRGQIDGFTSLLTLIPERKLGIILLANTPLVQPTGILRNRLLELLLELPLTDQHSQAVRQWLNYIRQQENEASGKVQKILDSDDRIKDTHPSHPLDAYTGKYVHPAYGTITVNREGDQLTISRNDHFSRLAHYHYDYFLTEALFPFFRTTLGFNMNSDGYIDQLIIQMETKADPVTFKKSK